MNRINEYISIKNSDGKEWVLPSDYLEIGLNIYQASSKKGLLLKKYLPTVMRIPVVSSTAKKILRISDVSLTITDPIIEKVKEVFDVSDPTFAYFAGTPSKHRKGTLQVSKGDKLLGYVKITESKEIAEIFYKEQEYLEWLKVHGLENIPTCLFCGRIYNSYIFIQDTIKTQNSIMLHDLGTVQLAFLKSLYMCTKTICSYDESEYSVSLCRLKQNKGLIFKYDVSCRHFEKGIDYVESALRGKREFSAYHGDFTPWNSFQENGQLYVFDFEYAKKTYPPYIDVFHYFTQSCIFEKNLDADQIFQIFIDEKSKKLFGELFEQPNVSYLEYLYSIISFYIDRDGGSMKIDDIRNLNVWLRLIDLLVERICSVK